MFSIVGKMLEPVTAADIDGAEGEKCSERCEINEVNHDAVIIAHAAKRRELKSAFRTLKKR